MNPKEELCIKAPLSIVGVMGSGTHGYEERASLLGRWLAGRAVHLLTGGGGGIMSSVSRAFYESDGRRGSVIGILPCSDNPVLPRAGYPNPWIEIPVFTHLPLSGQHGTDPRSRNHINILSSDVIVALPGGAGTVSELTLALRYRRPVIAFLESAGEIPDLPSGIPFSGDFDEICRFIDLKLAAIPKDK